ncbi:MAG TPA: hypothetical protein VHB93_00855, partial [Candidatus Paceibacterota bacterium]|nr:hypothetical protein [Candidatus Paceibacterota bacterium]
MSDDHDDHEDHDESGEWYYHPLAMGAGVIALLAVVGLVAWLAFPTRESPPGNQNTPTAQNGAPAAPAIAPAQALPPFSGKFTLEPVTYRVAANAPARFDALNRPQHVAHCTWPSATSSAFKKAEIVADNGTFEYVDGVAQDKKKKPDGLR